MKTILSSRRDRYLAIFTIFLVMVALIAGMVGCGGPPAEEEEEEEYMEDWYDLDDMRNNPGDSYRLMNNLNSTTDGWEELASPRANAGKGWEPIGTENQPFTGTFDGGGLSINGLHISRPDEDDVGLFGYVEGGIIENVGLMEVDVTGRTHTGALVGYNWKGIVGYGVRGTVNNCYSTGSVTGSDTVGGLVGLNKRGTVSLSGSSVDVYHVPGQCWRAGGLVGSNWGNVILCSYNGSVTGDHEVGGLVGLNLGNVLSCQGRHTVDGRYFVGGGAGANVWPGNFDGNALHFTVNNKTSFMALSESGTGDSGLPDTAPQGSYVGILAGYHNGTATDNIVIGSARGNEYAGGLVGYLGPEGEIRSSFAAATVEGNAYVGPLVGYKHPAATVTNSASVTPAEMTDIATFLGAGLEICAVAPGEVNTDCQWNIEPGGYPFLSGKRLEQYNLTISSTQNGEVTSPGQGTFTHYEGSVVSLVAQAEEGYRFVNWTGDVGTIADVEDATTTIAMSSDYSITANFEEGAPRVAVRDWYDLDAVRDNLQGHYVLMNDLDSTTAGYVELASPAANGGKGWEPLATFYGSFDGDGHEIEDLVINRPDEDDVGLFGLVDWAVIENLGVVNAEVTGHFCVGGLVGYSHRSTVSNSYSTGTVAGEWRVGCLVGENDVEGTVSNSYSTGSVTGRGTGNSHLGGLVGWNHGGVVSNSHSTSSVTGENFVGGLVGRNSDTVSNSCSTGSVAGNYQVGGLVGGGGGTVTNSFWDIQTSGQATSDGGTGKSTTEMHDMATFAAAGWDICAVAPGETNPGFVWNIVDEQTYPFLSWQS